MCGIVGYIGKQKALPILLEGLKRLEYRGYDSAGLAFLKNKEFQIVRAEGKLDQLVQKVAKSGAEFNQTIGMGHTRWATHGKVSEENAHPHDSKDFAVVHNGIIENHLALKKRLLEKGHEFFSETDTEVICHLLQDYTNQNVPILEAIQKTLHELRGAFSLVILHRETPHQIFAVKKGSPLVVGLCPDETFVASDVPALLSHTREVIFMDDGEIAVLSPGQNQFYSFDGQVVQKKSKTIQWNLAQAEKNGYKHFMLKEIMEQPRSLAQSLMGRIGSSQKSVSLPEVDALLDVMLKDNAFRILIVACGTSYHSGLVAKYWMEALARVPVSVELASEFRYRHPILDAATLVVAISQSGETADTLAAVEMSRAAGAKVVAICNVMESSITRKVEHTLYTNAGPEIGVASTKAFTTQLMVLYLLTLCLIEKKKTLPWEQVSNRIASLLKMPALLEDFLNRNAKPLRDIAERLCRSEHCYFLARGVQYPIVLEGALKLKEISYIHAEGYAAGEMKHGPIALIEEGIPVIGIALKDSVYEKTLSNLVEVESRGADVIALVSEHDTEAQKRFARHILIPDVHDDLHPFFTILPLQLLSYYAADRKGTDVDQPRNLAKSVTVE